MENEPEGIFPHTLGLNLVKAFDKRLTNFLQIQESYVVWLDEVLEECKKSLSRAQPELLPKTPSAKRSRRRVKVDDSIDEDQENIEPPRKRLSLAKRTERGNGEDMEVEADDESDASEVSTLRPTRRTRAASKNTASSSRSTRTTRARKNNTTSTSHKPSPVLCLTKNNQKTAQLENTPGTASMMERYDQSDAKHTPAAVNVSSGNMSGLKTPTAASSGLLSRLPILGKDSSYRDSPRPSPGSMSVKERASKYEQTVLSSGGNTPTPKANRIIGALASRSGSVTPGTPVSGSRHMNVATPTTVTVVKSQAHIAFQNSNKRNTATLSPRSVKQLRLCKTSQTSTTPVTRHSTKLAQPAARASLRRSLKASQSKTRRSSILRHRLSIAKAEEKAASGVGSVSIAESTSAGDESVSERTRERQSRETRSNDQAAVNEQVVPTEPVLQPKETKSKSKSKLKLKKTKVLRKKAETEDTTPSEVTANTDSSTTITTNLVTVASTIELAMETSQTATEEVPSSSEERRHTVTLPQTLGGEDILAISITLDSDRTADESHGNEENKSDEHRSPDLEVNTSQDEARRSSLPQKRKRSQDSTDRSECAKRRSVSRNSSGSQRKQSSSSARHISQSARRKSSQSKKISELATRKLSSRSSEQNADIVTDTVEDLELKWTITRSASARPSASTPEKQGRQPLTRSKGRKPKDSEKLMSSGLDLSANTDDENGEVFAVPDGPAPKAIRGQHKRQISEKEDDSDTDSNADTKRPCFGEESATEEGHPSESESENAQDEDLSGTSIDEHNSTMDRSSDGDIVERSPSPECPRDKIIRPNPESFLNAFTKDANKLFNINTTGIKSFLRISPVKKPPSVKEQQEIRRKELKEKQRKDNERLMRRKHLLQQQADEKKRIREERLRKVHSIRKIHLQKDQEKKDKLLEKLEHKNKIPEQILEGKRKEKEEQKQLRQQKHTDAEERRLQEEAERLRILKEKEEEERIHHELLQRKREFEEQERQRKIAEDKRKQEEQLAEMEKKHREEELKQQLLEQENERLRQKHLADKEQEQQRIRIERVDKEKRDLEIKRQREKEVEDEFRKLKELERIRIREETQRQEEIQKIEERYKQLISKQNSVFAGTSKPVVKPVLANSSSKPTPPAGSSLNTTLTLPQPTITSSPQSYQITPPRKPRKKCSAETYDISGLRSDESTDDEDAPKRKIPTWASGAPLKVALVNQFTHPIDTAMLFGVIELPDLNKIFTKKKRCFDKRSSSANWDSPLLKTTSTRS